mmetsp:Transcript_104728/g.254200  ORF Transcript_104728/g.254200 Transcript_104728/m.254200 type:complete len:169 (+) Transcript_104728:80-586(+)
MVYSADDFSLTRPEGQDREIHVTTCNWQILLVRRSLWDVLRGGDLRDAALPIFARADQGGRVLHVAEPCRATGARKTYWKTLMARMAGCCTSTMAIGSRRADAWKQGQVQALSCTVGRCCGRWQGCDVCTGLGVRRSLGEERYRLLTTRALHEEAAAEAGRFQAMLPF